MVHNNAIIDNPNTQNGKTAAIAITTHGSDWYYAVCALMGLTTLTILGLTFVKKRTDHFFLYITAGVNFVATIAYFSLGSNLGWTPIDVEYPRSDPRVSGINREIFYVRYIDWVITTPLLLMDLLLTAGVPWPTIVWTVLVDEIMIITGLVGALVKTRYKWGFYAFGCFAMFYVFSSLFMGRNFAQKLGTQRVYSVCSGLTVFVWLCYPIAWGLCEGGNVISPDSEAIFYGVLDLLAKPVFSIILIFMHKDTNLTRLGLRLRKDDEEIVPNYTEKDAYGQGERLVGNGNTNGNSLGYTTGTEHNGSTNI